MAPLQEGGSQNYAFGESYLKLCEDEAKRSRDASYLLKDIKGETVVAVHGQGILAFSPGESDEELKQDVWSEHATFEHWLVAARARREFWERPEAVRPPLRWQLVEKGDSFTDQAVQTGSEASGEILYSARSWLEGGLHPGKAGRHLQGGALIPYGSVEYPVDTYEILVGDAAFASWVEIPRDRVLNIRASPPTPTQALYTKLAPKLSFVPIEGGRDAEGKCLLVAQAFYEEGWHPGKARVGDDHCCIAYAGGEVWVRPFRILAYEL